MSSWSRCRPAPPGRRARVAGPGPRVRAGGPGRPVRAGGRTGRRAPGVGGGARSLLVDLHNASSDVFQLGPCRVMHLRVTCLTRRGPCKTRGLTCFAGERRRRAGKAPPGPTRPPASSSHAQSVPPIPWPRAARLNCRRARRWRNRLTRCPQKALSFGTCGFESHPPHYIAGPLGPSRAGRFGPSRAGRFRPSRAGAEATNRVGCSPAGAPPRSGLPARRSSPAQTPASRTRSAAPARESAAA
jgi:hypothetical protein